MAGLIIKFLFHFRPICTPLNWGGLMMMYREKQRGWRIGGWGRRREGEGCSPRGIKWVRLNIRILDFCFIYRVGIWEMKYIAHYFLSLFLPLSLTSHFTIESFTLQFILKVREYIFLKIWISFFLSFYYHDFNWIVIIEFCLCKSKVIFASISELSQIKRIWSSSTNLNSKFSQNIFYHSCFSCF